MVYTYSDNGDLVIVVKNAKSIPGINEMVGQIIMAATDEVPEQAEDTELEPEEIVINDDDSFSAVAADFRAGRFNGPLRDEAAKKLNQWCRDRFHDEDSDRYPQSLKDEEVDKFLMNYDSIIPKALREKYVNESGMGSWDIFVVKGDMSRKRALISDIISRF